MKQFINEGHNHKDELDKACPKLKFSNVIAAVCEHIEVLVDQAKLIAWGAKLCEEYKGVFDPLPHYDNLSDEIHCRVILKDASKTITTWLYSCPRKYREALKTLLQQHRDASRIHLSSSLYASPTFIVPKSDPTVLSRWVNDYRQINMNTVTDSYPLPHVEDILADAGRGKIQSKMDMMNSFFHTWMHPDSIVLMAIMTLFGLYGWMVIPMGLHNSPPVHQQRVANALWELIGKVCHIYLDNIIIWSLSLEEHENHVQFAEWWWIVWGNMGCNWMERNWNFFCTEVDFLGHHISSWGIKVNSSKVDKILNWPVLKLVSGMWAFLGLVRYISGRIYSSCNISSTHEHLCLFTKALWPI